LIPVVLLCLTLTSVRGQVSDEISFRKHTLDLGRNETCAVADLNGDGRLDIVVCAERGSLELRWWRNEGKGDR